MASAALPGSSAYIAERLRPYAKGKFVFVGKEKFYVRGVTYGPFRPEADGCEYHVPEVVGRDFALMAAHGINTVRTYTVPPRWLLDMALRHGLRVMIGLPWEQHITFLDRPAGARDIERRVREGVRACAGHTAVLCYTVGNEIPASIVRWYGARRVERFLERLYRAAKAEDPGGLVAYVNFPTTEYLDLSFADLVCFNVYLESQERLEAYVARLHNLAGDRPLLLAEIGLDSRRNGEHAQARALDWQLRTTFAAGCAGAFAFAWTDEWHRGGYDIEDWDFGLTTRDRQPKPALAAVSEAFAEVPFPRRLEWPRISVVVCAYNAADTLAECLQGLAGLDYPDYEVIVVDDGSADATSEIAARHPCRLIRTENRGLSAARNTGLEAATGAIVAYIDSDAYPDPHWLTYLAASFMHSGHAGIGGPNLAPPGDDPIADCVANAPGGPVHVLLSDREAEHIPGCNMAFRKRCLEAIGGFDPQFRAAGDDVDVCWRLQQRGWTLGFSPAAVVWHRRRNSVRAYWKQQVGYGRAEALLERKWPEKYNRAGHVSWAGRMYGKGLPQALLPARGRIYQGTWGTALFQSVYQPASGLFSSLPLMPEWYLLLGGLGALAGLGLLWPPLRVAIPLLALAALILFGQAARGGLRASLTGAYGSRTRELALRLITGSLHLLQPLARLWGRITLRLSPLRRRGVDGLCIPRPRAFSVWSERWRDAPEWLHTLEAALKARRAGVRRGGDFDDWDLEVRDGAFGTARLRSAIEEHGAGRQLIRFRVWPRPSRGVLGLGLLLAALSVGAALDGARSAALLMGGFALLLCARALDDCAVAMGAVRRTLREWGTTEERRLWPVLRDRGATHLPRRPTSLAGRSPVPAATARDPHLEVHAPPGGRNGRSRSGPWSPAPMTMPDLPWGAPFTDLLDAKLVEEERA